MGGRGGREGGGGEEIGREGWEGRGGRERAGREDKRAGEGGTLAMACAGRGGWGG